MGGKGGGDQGVQVGWEWAEEVHQRWTAEGSGRKRCLGASIQTSLGSVSERF